MLTFICKTSNSQQQVVYSTVIDRQIDLDKYSSSHSGTRVSCQAPSLIIPRNPCLILPSWYVEPAVLGPVGCSWEAFVRLSKTSGREVDELVIRYGQHLYVMEVEGSFPSMNRYALIDRSSSRDSTNRGVSIFQLWCGYPLRSSHKWKQVLA